MSKSIVFFICFALCSFLGALPAAAGDYRIVTNQLPPLKFEENGVAKGITVGILLSIMKKIGEPFEAREIETLAWARAFEDVKNQPGTMILSIARTAEREALLKWVGPVYSIQLGLIGRKNMDFDIQTAADAARYRVGALRDTAPEKLLVKQGFPHEKVYHLARTEQALGMLNEGRIDLFAHTADSSFYMMPSLGMDPDKFQVYYVIEQDIPLFIGLNRSFSDAFVSRMQKAMDEIKSPRDDGTSEYDDILNTYFPNRPMLKKKEQ